MLTSISLMILISDQLYTWSDGSTKRTRRRTAETPQHPGASTPPAQIDSARFPHRAIQTMWQAWMQMCRRCRTWPQVLSVGELSWPAAANGLCAAGGLWANSGVYRQLSPESRDSGDDLRDQPRIAAPSRGALKRHHERVFVCHLRPDGCGTGWCASRQYARRLARRRPGEFGFCGGSR
jgi:hypothetical protein